MAKTDLHNSVLRRLHLGQPDEIFVALHPEADFFGIPERWSNG